MILNSIKQTFQFNIKKTIKKINSVKFNEEITILPKNIKLELLNQLGVSFEKEKIGWVIGFKTKNISIITDIIQTPDNLYNYSHYTSASSINFHEIIQIAPMYLILGFTHSHPKNVTSHSITDNNTLIKKFKEGSISLLVSGKVIKCYKKINKTIKQCKIIEINKTPQLLNKIELNWPLPVKYFDIGNLYTNFSVLQDDLITEINTKIWANKFRAVKKTLYFQIRERFILKLYIQNNDKTKKILDTLNFMTSKNLRNIYYKNHKLSLSQSLFIFDDYTLLKTF